ncbi:hypothetical protein QF205_13405 [Luteimonas composti]|uniref:Uncharacterized protein n=1 Tax=Luteimonas composti TaxID=398257 RepID=A0ABT6MTU8_9GAMM|nr:hypothetical protein [Luteimonas composti]MDH7454057.1 hypothetical protein [Luteimonas composti]
MKINFVLNTSANYSEVQESLFSLVQAELDAGEYSRGRYVDGALNFSLFIRDRADVVMSHGVADKNYFWIRDPDGQRFANRLKAVLVPGRWLRKRILKSSKLELGEDQVITVGWPRIDQLRAMPRPQTRGRKVLLWAPTHDAVKRGAEERSTSSYPDFGRHLPALSKRFDVEVSLHPRNRVDKRPTLEKLLEADFVVSDFGTLVYEAWALGKPVLFPRWILGDRIQQYLPRSAEAHIFDNRIGYHPESLEDMLDILEAGPVITPDVVKFMAAYVDNYRAGNSAAAIAAALRRLAAGETGAAPAG